MPRIKAVKMQFVVNVEVGCNSPEEFNSSAEFARSADIKLMPTYLKEKIRDALDGSYQYTAEVKKFVVKRVREK